MKLTEIAQIEEKKVAFSRWWFFDEKFSMMIPDDMLAATPREISVHYASFTTEYRPLVLLRNHEFINVSFYLINKRLENDQVAAQLEIYRKQQSMAYHLTSGMLNGQKGLQIGYFDFIDASTAQRYYSFYCIMPFEDQLLHIKGIAPDYSGRYLEFRSTFRYMVKSAAIEI